ncbi:hypothetical protein H9P43_005639 [Blastocladiella emersonii ATCC 22665]|nr:hypothetical protein H9P43_005639 [Blastocladiella emersonii ATCC 22665]
MPDGKQPPRAPVEDDDIPRTSSTASIPRSLPHLMSFRRTPKPAHPADHDHDPLAASHTLDADDVYLDEEDSDDAVCAPSQERQQLKYLLCGAVAGAVSRTCTAPLDRLKVLLQTQTSAPGAAVAAPSFRTSMTHLRHASTAIYQDGGIRSFWRGNGMNCVKIVPESAIKFYVFEQSKRLVATMQGWDPDDPETNIGVHGRFVAGGLGGLCSQFSIYPIETLKTRVMAATQARAAAAAAAANAQSAAADIAAAAAAAVPKPRAGLSPAAAAAAAPHLRPYSTFAASAAAPAAPPNPQNLIMHTARDMWREGGWRAFFRGLGPSLIGIVPYAGIDLAIYETLKGTYGRMHADPVTGDLPTPPVMYLLVMGTISGSVGATAVYPLSLIRTRLQAQGTPGHPERYASAMDAVRKAYAREGARGFYKGLAPTLIKVIPAASISYVCYEGMKSLVGL